MRKTCVSQALIVLLVWVCFLTTGASTPKPGSPRIPLSTRHMQVAAHRWVFDAALAQWKPVMLSSPLHGPLGIQREPAAGKEFALSTAAGWQVAPVVAWNSLQGEFLAVWEDFRNGSDRDLYAQRFTANGRLIGDNHAIVIGQYDQADPVLLNDRSDGGYILIWHHQQPGNDGIYWQRLSSTGTALGAPLRVPSPGDRQQWIPGGAFNTVRSEFLVVWEDLTTYEIVGQRIASGNGEPLGDPITISDRPKLQWTPPFVAFNLVWDEYLVIWDDLLHGDLFGQVVAADGRLRGEELAISVAAGKQFASDLVYSGARDEYLALWTDARGSAADDSNVYCQRVAGGGQLLGDEQVVSGAPGLQQDCVGWYDRSHDEYMLLWWDGRDARTANDIHGQRVSANGPLLGPDIAVSDNPSDQVYPALAYREASDQYAVVWQEWHSTNDWDVEADVYGMLYSPLRFNLRFPWVAQGWLQLVGDPE